jgi:hypothetical protein
MEIAFISAVLFPSGWIIAIGPVQEENMYVRFCPVFGLGGAFVLDFTRLG